MDREEIMEAAINKITHRTTKWIIKWLLVEWLGFNIVLGTTLFVLTDGSHPPTHVIIFSIVSVLSFLGGCWSYFIFKATFPVLLEEVVHDKSS